ncbi:MAG TPA: VWA domain-containing protein [Blastocatellia bacterium]|nr:VWA domain-containing protein [Blastocatellia bacterium]
MRIEFTNPWALGLLALIPLAVYFARHSLANLSRRRGQASLVVRVIMLLLAVLALAGLRVRTSSRDVAVLFVVDVSASVAQESRAYILDAINNEINRAGPRDYVGVVAFGREPAVELAPTRKETLGDWRIKEIASSPPRDYTDIAAALRLAAALVPEDATGRLVLISDGNENLESVTDEAQLLRAAGTEVFTRAINTTSERNEARGEVAIRQLDAPPSLAEGESFDLKVTVDSTRDTAATLRIFRNDSVVSERAVQLQAAGENVFILPQRVEQKGFFTYRAEVEAAGADTFQQNNSREAFAIVEGKPKTLYLYGDPKPSPGLLRVLAEASFTADVRAAADVPTTLAGFQDYDLVIFDNVPAAVMTPGQMKMVQAYVRDLGGGFVMVGGDQSFGPGGYYKTPVEETLPVSLDVRQKKHFPALAIVLVIDKSGSMLGSKIEMALEASSATVDFLSERDSVGVVAFDSSAYPVVSLTKVEDKKAIIDKIGTIQALGGTNIYPGIKMAYDWLQASDAQIKHIIVMSDGQSEPGDFRGIARSVRDAGMTLSTVALGDDADFDTMKFLADGGGGRFYAADTPDKLPRIFTREAFLASKSTIIEEPFVPRFVRATQATNGIDWSTAPQLGGYVGTAERDPVKSPAITALMSDKDDPVYAVWQYGLGRAAAFTSDAKPRWASGWMNWPGFGQFWTQAFRDVLRRQGSVELQPRVEVNAGRGHVTVEAASAEGEFKNNLRLKAHVIAPDLTATDVTLEQTAAGRYEGDFPATLRGAYLANISEESGTTAPVAGAVNSYSPEFSIVASDTNLLTQISEATGGASLPALTTDAAQAGGVNLFERRAARTMPHEIWEALLLAALLLLPIDVGIRRVALSREQIERARAWVASKLRRRVPLAVDAEAVASMASLKEARSRVRLSDAPADAVTAAATQSPLVIEPARRNTAAGNDAQSDSRQVSKARHSADATNSAAPAQEGSPLASRLLDARKKRRG